MYLCFSHFEKLVFILFFLVTRICLCSVFLSQLMTRSESLLIRLQEEQGQGSQELGERRPWGQEKVGLGKAGQEQVGLGQGGQD